MTKRTTKGTITKKEQTIQTGHTIIDIYSRFNIYMVSVSAPTINVTKQI